MKKRTNLILQIMNILFWVVFIGLCIKTGAIITSFFISLFVNPEAAKDLYLGLNLFALHQANEVLYVFFMAFIIFLSGLKSYFAYLVVKISLKLNIDRPFSSLVAGLLMKISYVALGIGILTLLANGYEKWLKGTGLDLPILHNYIGSSGDSLFMAGVIFIIAQIFKRGIELQFENELTI